MKILALDEWERQQGSPSDPFHALIEHLRGGRGGLPWCRWVDISLGKKQFLVSDGRWTECEFREIIQTAANAFFDEVPPPVWGRGDAWVLTVLLGATTVYEEAETALQEERASLLSSGLMGALLHPESCHNSLTPGPPGFPYRLRSPFLTLRWASPNDELFVAINPVLHELWKAWFRLHEE